MEQKLVCGRDSCVKVKRGEQEGRLSAVMDILNNFILLCLSNI